MLPIVCGVSYELIKFAGRHTNLFTRIISAPGLWLQRLTTCEPNDRQIEVAITAMEEVIPEVRVLTTIEQLARSVRSPAGGCRRGDGGF